MENIIIEQLKENDVDFVFDIQRTFFDVHDKSSILASFNSDTLSYFSLKLNGIVVGYLECSIILDEAEIYEIAIAKEFQGMGLSSKLMQFFLDYLKERNVRTIFLEVNIINNKAINLYKKFGFVEYSRRKNYYGDNDAILMKLQR